MRELLDELFRLPAAELFGLSVLATVISTCGALISLFIKEHLLARSFESWKRRQELRAVYARYRDPLLLSAQELLWRLREIVFQSPVNFLTHEGLKSDPKRLQRNDANDPYYRLYKFDSTVYRFCTFWAWCELYRRDITFLDSGRSERNRCVSEPTSPTATSMMRRIGDRGRIASFSARSFVRWAR